MKKFILLITLNFTFLGIYAQSVVASGGQSGTSNQLHASATIGEAIIGAQNNGAQSANQGFQQPLQKDITSVIEASPELKINVTVGPIPTTGFVQLKLEKPFEGTFILMDQLGRVIKKSNITKHSLNYSMILSQYDAATYYLTIISMDGKKLTSIPIIKI